MDLKQLTYIVQIAKENNITRAAEALFLTQSALNQQLLKLERDLGTPLFYRSRTNWRPTEAGEIYITAAKEMLRLKQETYNRIHDIARIRKGHLSVGLAPGRGIPMFTTVYPAFHQIYPDVVVTPVESSVRRQQEMVMQGELDLGFLTLWGEPHKPNLRYYPICEEDILLAIPPGHPFAKYTGETFGTLDIAQLREESFVLIYKDSSLRPMIDQIFQQAGFQPRVLFETSNNSAIVDIIHSGLCCGIIPRHYVANRTGDVACFYLPGRPTWNITACYRKDSYLSQAAKHFIGLAADYWVRSAI